ncbi:putative alpha/beta hydrolase [Hortaea werneckii]|nr:putative alpha/beta hydrolase [Hortaea werneckii]KAI6910141.1 putative alpha/beta hydrolase [Hortaea werneckii]KAI6941498.1 putative alpha/beta hydrolase [Hortaea werneckii]KAI6972733.1 putative alpha/beta hydrolase [Hortaea werneckii]KAI7076803.1 putative alpha/beta hydrolase [Hortaea werneckii]
METIKHINMRDRRVLYIAAAAPLAAYTGFRLFRSLATLRRRPVNAQHHVIPSPRHSLQLLSAQDLTSLPYPPNALPGARDVDTPYGNIRVYEWGPEDGRKVLLVHGISTPCIALANLADSLVDKGCRVMLFDLFGRGYSDTPDPARYPQDTQLFSSQILCVLASSKLAWTGPNRFTLVGYSLGGGIGASFASYFPELVEGLVLIAPSGLLRPKHISAKSKLLYGNLLPQSLIHYYVGNRLRGGPPSIWKQNSNSAGSNSGNPEATTTGAIQAAESEVPSNSPSSHPAQAPNSSAPIFPNRPAISPANAVGWQVDAHPGFVPAFISSIQHAPITEQHERWRLVGHRQEAARASSGDKTDDLQSPSANAAAGAALKEKKVLILLGEQDSVIIADEAEEDANKAMGKDNVEVVRLEGGHDVPIVAAKECGEATATFWKRER